MPPTISVCIPVFNGAHLITEAMSSVINQTYQDIEVIVVDNASTDDTEAVVKSWPDARIKYYKNGKNIGYPANVNRALSLASGDLITILCADDYFVDEFVFERWIAAIRSNPNCVAVHSSFIHPEEIVCDALLKANEETFRSPLVAGINTPEATVRNFLKGSGFFGWGWCFSSNLVKEHQLRFNEELTMAPDTLFWMKISTMGNVYETPVDKPAYAFVIRKNSLGRELFRDYWEKVVLELCKFEEALFDVIAENISTAFAQDMESQRGVYTVNESICILKNNYVRGRVGWIAAVSTALRVFCLGGLKCFNKRFLANFILILLPRSISILALKGVGSAR